MPGAIFVDTWGWIAMGHRKDARHSEVIAYYKELRSSHTRLVTSDYVLDEVATLLFRRETFDEAEQFLSGILSATGTGQVALERITPARFEAAWALRRRFRDKPLVSFTDLSSMALMHELGVTGVLTEDDHCLRVGMGFVKVP